MDFLENISRKSKEYIYKLGRRKFIHDTIASIGRIIEDDHCITCLVQQNLLYRNAKPNIYQLNLFGMNNKNEEIKKIIEYYNLNKPVHYIFDGIHFDRPINIFSFFCDITFINCKFTNSYFNISHADKITFAGNQFYDGISVIKKEAFLRTVSTSKVGELNFKNENFINKSKSKEYGENFGLDIVADKVNIMNSTITAYEKKGEINIFTKEIEIRNSTVCAPEIYLDSDEIIYEKSLFKANKGIIIENKNNNCDTEVGFYNMISPYIVYNGTEIIWNGLPNVRNDTKAQPIGKVLQKKQN